MNGWTIEPGDFGVLETLVNAFHGYMICYDDADYRIDGIDGEHLVLEPVDEDMKVTDGPSVLVPLADDIKFLVY